MRWWWWPAALRVVMIVAAYGAVSGLSEACPTPVSTSGTVLFTMLAALATVWPDSYASLPFFVTFGWYWIVRVETPVTAWSIPVAIALATYHTATAMASIAPWRAPAVTSIIVRWTARLVAVSAVPAVVWSGARLLHSSRGDGHDVLFGAALLLVGAATWFVAAMTRAAPRSAPLIVSGHRSPPK